MFFYLLKKSSWLMVYASIILILGLVLKLYHVERYDVLVISGLIFFVSAVVLVLLKKSGKRQ